jgi:hypothetical protein
MTLLNQFKRAGQKLLTRASPLLQKALPLIVISQVLIGCAGFYKAPPLDPSVQEEINKALIAETKGVPFRVIGYNEFNELKNTIKKSVRGNRENGGLKESAYNKARGELSNFVLSHAKSLTGEKQDQEFQTALKTLSEASLLNLISTGDREGDKEKTFVLQLITNLRTPFYLVVLDGDNIYKPTSEDAAFFDSNTGLKGLQEALGHSPLLVRLALASHEFDHVGYSWFKPSAFTFDRDGISEQAALVITEKQDELNAEASADLSMAKTFINLLNNKVFVYDYMMQRALQTALANDATHATHFAIAQYMTKVAPDMPIPAPFLEKPTITEIQMGHGDLALLYQKTGCEVEGDVFPQKEEEIMALYEKRLGAIAAVDVNTLASPYQKTIIAGAQEALKYFQKKMAPQPTPRADVSPLLGVRANPYALTK